MYTTVTSADILKLHFMAGAAMSLPAPDAARARLGRRSCQTSSTLLGVMAAPVIRLTVMRAVHTPLGSKRRC